MSLFVDAMLGQLLVLLAHLLRIKRLIMPLSLQILVILEIIHSVHLAIFFFVYKPALFQTLNHLVIGLQLLSCFNCIRHHRLHLIHPGELLLDLLLAHFLL